jgi:hypothetical protein
MVYRIKLLSALMYRPVTAGLAVSASMHQQASMTLANTVE